jgi:hypothetical protein
LAHGSGVDEIILFVVPATLAIFGLRWAERRARREAETSAEAQTGEADPPAQTS